MFARRTPSNVVRVARLDAGFYDPVYVENASKVESHVGDTVTNLCPRLLDHSFLSIRTEDYLSAGVPFVRVKNLKGMVLDEDFIFIDEEANQRESQTICTPGDLLFAKTGKIAACPVPAHLQQVNTSQDVMVGTVRHGTDPYYVAAYLNCRHGSLYQERYVQGPVQPHLSLGSLRQIYVVTPQPDAQRYIGDKVRQAERLRERARRLEADVRRKYRAAVDRLGYVEAPHRKSFRTRLRDRLDPAYYDPAFTSVLDAPWLTSNSEPLSRFFSDGSYGDLPDSGTYGTGDKWLLRATDLDQCMTHWDAGLRVPAAEVGAKSQVKENDILLEVKGAIEKCAIGRGPAVGKHVNGTVFRLSPSGINAGYLCLHLTAEIKRKYAAREAVNNIIQYLNLDCIRALPVLRLDVDLEDRLGGSFIEAVDARTAATTSTSAATTLVEHLIEGRINEADLVAAQKALEASDRSADREILKALRQSDAPDAKPLIADVNALYALLDGPEGQDA